ncbi:DUF6665 family protein [Longimicrobium sp.]|uniref:DUF6665 family protein n=1 Tax=Longimicrobium sp. TaxID=2029185 RepID=UPI002E35211F|nr:DUF6665 family protein [Longimicrobium sp.]HEX6040188.1 DUF6665 family protein [Longimicrobium sp.]
MSLRIPRSFSSPDRGGKMDALNYELLQESAATLARLGKRLEGALEALSAHDAAHDGDAPKSAKRDQLVGAAGEALWYYVIQREVMGLTETESVMRHLGVPREVRLRMGLNRRPDASP